MLGTETEGLVLRAEVGADGGPHPGVHVGVAHEPGPQVELLVVDARDVADQARHPPPHRLVGRVVEDLEPAGQLRLRPGRVDRLQHRHESGRGGEHQLAEQLRALEDEGGRHPAPVLAGAAHRRARASGTHRGRS